MQGFPFLEFLWKTTQERKGVSQKSQMSSGFWCNGRVSSATESYVSACQNVQILLTKGVSQMDKSDEDLSKSGSVAPGKNRFRCTRKKRVPLHQKPDGAVSQRSKCSSGFWCNGRVSSATESYVSACIMCFCRLRYGSDGNRSLYIPQKSHVYVSRNSPTQMSPMNFTKEPHKTRQRAGTCIELCSGRPRALLRNAWGCFVE